MKKTLQIITALALTFMFAACGTGNQEATQEVTITPEEVQEVHQLDSVSAEITNEAQNLENNADKLLEELQSTEK